MEELAINSKACVQPPVVLFRPFVTALFSVIFSLEDVMRKASPSLFPILSVTARNSCAEFYDKFQHMADDYDRDVITK